jgi:MoaA/NifB/PqqE/SkfB family radical SAM enzyme
MEDNMIIANLKAVAKLARKNPGLISVAYANLSHQLFDRLGGRKLNGWSHAPEVINVFVTDRCNLRCRECHYAYTDTPGFKLNQVGDMHPDIFYKLIDEIPGRPLLSFTGGEPLLHPQVLEFVSAAKAKGFKCSMVSNGWLLAARAQEICDSGLDALAISVDGPRSTHNSVRGKNSFERLEKGLETMLRIPNRPLMFISMAISDLNYDKLIPTYNLAKQWEVDGMNFNHLWMQTDEMVQGLEEQPTFFTGDHVGWKVNNDDIDINLLADELEEIRALSWGGDMLVTESPYFNRQEMITWYREPTVPVKHSNVRCGWIRMKIWSDGKVKPCRDWEIGNILDEHARDIWNGQELREFRKTLAEQGMLPICTRCCFIAHR